jgi:hypothetical protein
MPVDKKPGARSTNVKAPALTSPSQREAIAALSQKDASFLSACERREDPEICVEEAIRAALERLARGRR